MDIGRELHQLRTRLEQAERSARLSHASLDGTAITVKDTAGAVRGAIGMQPDGTLGIIAVDGPPPGAPTAPVVTPSIGGLRIVWDGALADGSTLPADFDHVAVHVSTTDGFTPSAATFVGTITKSGDGGMLPVTPLPYTAHYVVLTAVNSSGIAGPPSAQTTATPVQVDGPDLTVGSVTAAAIEAGAVTADKLEAILQLVTRIVAGDPNGARVELNEDGLRVYDASDVLVIQFNSADGSAVFTGDITGSDITGSTITGTTVTGGLIQTDATGERVAINAGGFHDIRIYDATNTVIGVFNKDGIGWKGTTGATLGILATAALPNIFWKNAAQTKSAIIQAKEDGSGNLAIETVTSRFADGGPYSDLIWHHYMGKDIAFIERTRDDGAFSTYIGGACYFAPGYARLQLNNTDSPTQRAQLSMEPAVGVITDARFQVIAPASANSALYVQALTGHTGNLLRLYRDADKFVVDTNGNVTAAGTVLRETAWSNLSYGSGWTGYGSPFGVGRYRLNTRGGVDLRDMVKRTAATTPTNGEVIATLPVGYRPANSIQWQQIVGGSGGVLSMNVATTGAISITSLNAAASTYLATGSGYISLNNCSFPLDA